MRTGTWGIRAFVALMMAVLGTAQAQLPTNGRLSQPGEVDEYVFRVDTERLVYFDSRTREPRLQWSLLGPFGVVSDTKTFSGSDSVAQSLFRVTPGEYRLKIEGQGDLTGDYAFRLSLLGDGTVIGVDVPENGTLNPANATEFYQFTPAAGDRYRISVPDRTNLPSLTLAVVDPFGNVLAQATPGSPDEFQTRNGLPHSLLVIGGINNAGEGTYRILLAKLGNSPLYQNAPTLVLGVENVTNSAGLFTNRFRFTLPKDTLLGFSPMVAVPGDRWQLDGPERSTGDQSFATSSRVQRAPAGEYQLTVWRQNIVATPMRFTIQDLDLAPTITLGSAVVHTNRPAGLGVYFRMPMVAGQRAVLLPDAIQGFQQGRPRWEVLSPDGAPLRINGQSFVNSTTDLGPWTAPVSGDYWLAAAANYYEDSEEGVRQFRWVDASNSERALTLGQEISGAIEKPYGVTTLRFQVNGRKRLHFDSLAATPVSWRLEGPLGVVTSGRFENETPQPVVVVGGEYRLILSASGEETPTYQFRVLDLEEATPVTLGESVVASHQPAQGTAVYQVTLNAGQRVLGRALASAGFPSERPRWYLFDPDGRMLWGQGYADSSVVTTTVTGKHLLVLLSPQSGTAALPTQTFSVLPVLQREETLAVGAMVSGAISSPGETVTYRFRVDAPMRVSVDHLISADANWQLIGPSGALTSGVFYSDSPWETVLLPGDHRFVVTATGIQTPEYRFRILNAGVGDMIQVGKTNEVALDSARGSRYLRVDLEAGQKLFLDRLGSSGFVSEPGVILTGPEGNAVLNQRFADVGAFTIPSRGIHTLLFRGDIGNADAAATVRFVLRRADELVSSVVPGVEIVGSISTPGEVRRFRWNQSSFRHYLMDSLLSSSLGWSVTGAWGPVGSGVLYSQGQVIGVPAGDVELTLKDSGESTSAYRLRLLAFEEAVPVSTGVETVATLAPGTGSVLYGVRLAAGQRIQVRSLGVSGLAQTPHWALYNPRFANVRSANMSVLDYTALDEGIHVVSIGGSLQETADGGSVRFVVEDLGTTPPAPFGGPLIAFNQLVSGTLGTVDEVHTFRLMVTERTLATMDVTKAGAQRWSMRDRFNAEVSNVPLRDSDTANRSDVQLLVLQPGEHELRLTGAVGAYEFRWLNAAEAPVVAPETPQTLVHIPANATRWVAFEGTAGEGWTYVGSPSTGFARRPYMQLWGPSGQLQTTEFADGFVDQYLLKETGRHLMYFAPFTEETGATGTNTFQWNGTVDPAPFLSLNTIMDVETRVPGARPTFQFQLNEPRRLIFDAMSSVASMPVLVQGPSGVVQRFSFNGSDIDAAADGAVMNLGVGRYTVVFDPPGPTTPSFRFAIRDLTLARELVLNQEMVGTNAPANRSTLYEFLARAGESFLYEGRGGSGYAGAVYADAYFPETGGVDLTSLGSYSSRFVVPRSGVVQLMLSAGTSDSGVEGVHRFRLWRVVDETNRLTLGTVVAGDLTVPSQQQVWNFRLSEPRFLMLDSLSNSSVNVQLSGPGGNFVSSSFRSYEESNNRQLIVAPAGDYSLILSANGLDTPSYRFRLLDVGNAPLVPAGVATTADFDLSRGVAVRRFRGIAGDAVYFDVLESTGFATQTSHRLLSSNGDVVFDTFGAAEPGRVVLPYTGDYFLVLNSPTFDPTTPPTYRYRFVVNPAAQPELILGTESLADLVPESISATPNPILSGGTLTVRWNLANRGRVSVPVPTTDRVVVRNESGEVLVTQSVVDADGPLAPGQSRLRQVDVKLPDGTSATGVLTVEVGADATGIVREGNAAGTGEANNVAVATVVGQLDAYPDLRVMGLRVATASPQPGAEVLLEWVTTNAGTRVARAPWSERVVVRNVGRRLVLVDVGSSSSVDLAPGGSVGRLFRLNLPVGANGYGTFAVQVQVDAAGQVAEFSQTGDAERNNAADVSFSTALDLEVSDVRLPTTIEPGVAFPVVYAVTNRTSISATGSWIDTLVRVNPGQADVSLAAFPVSAGVPAHGLVMRTNYVTLPLDVGIESLRVALTTDGANSLEELDEENNRRESNQAVVSRVLTLDLSVSSLREDAVNPEVLATLTRSGSVSTPLLVQVTSSDDTELQVPSEVMIPAGDSRSTFATTVVRDGLPDGPQTVRVRVQAEDYKSAEKSVTVLDADVVRLALRLDASEVREGGVLRGVVSRTPVTTAPLSVQLVSSDSAQVSVPGTVVIPASAAEVAFDVLAVEDTLLERTNVYTLTASAPSVPSVSASLGVVDNDVPQVRLALAQRTVSEGGGANATSLTLTRNPVTARAVTIALVSGNPDVVRLPATAVILAGAATATIPVGVIDNAVSEGARAIVLGGSVLSTVGAAPVGDVIPEVLTVTDNDGPTLTLKLAAEAVSEGLSPATVGTVIRNTSTAGSLVVGLVSSDTTEATVPLTVTIPAGLDRVEFPIQSIADSISDGNQAVVVTASANGFVDGVSTLVVSDSDRPDLVIAGISFGAAAVAGESVPVTVRVENRGATPAVSSVLQRLSISSDAFAGGDVLAGQLTYPGPVPAGSYFEQTLNVRLPDLPGNYYFVAETDVSQVVEELLESNNLKVSPSAIEVRPAYTATVETDVTAALAGSSVTFKGRAVRGNGAGADRVAVNVFVMVRGTTRTLPVVSGADGRFEVIFRPLPTEGGLYRISAAAPGVAVPAAQDEFRLLGMTVASVPRLTVSEGGVVEATTTVENRTDLPLTGLVTEVVQQHKSLNATVELDKAALAGEGTAELKLKVTTVDTSAVESDVVIRVRSAEGAEATLTTRVRQEIRVPRLVSAPGSLSVAMVRGRQTPVTLTLRNEGGLETGPLRVQLPSVSWLSLSSPTVMDSLAPGSNVVVTLLLTPPADLALGDYSSGISVGSDRVSLSVPASFRAISDGIGDLVVTAEDEYSYFAEGTPKLANALVVLNDALSGTPVRTNVTGIDGRAVFGNLPEAYYIVTATAEDHGPFRQTALVLAGGVTNVTAFLSRETVKYSFTVEPTTVEDRYTLRVESKFETQVPVPVITIEPAAIDIAQYPGQEFQIDVTVRNHGLIAANSVRLNVPAGRSFTVTPLVTDLGPLPAGASLTIPVTIRRVPPAARSSASRLSARGQAKPALPSDHNDDLFDDEACSSRALLLWDFLCGPNLIGRTEPWTIFDSIGCDESELFTRVFRYETTPLFFQSWVPMELQLFIASLPTFPFNYAAIPTFRRVCRVGGPITGPLPNNPSAASAGRGQAALAAGEAEPPDVCARVSLKLNQSAVLTRDAFKATLEVENDTDSKLESVLVNLVISRPNGTNVTELFGIRPPELEAFSSVDGVGELGTRSTGRARWTLIPTLDVAPTNGPSVLLVSGTLSYRQDGKEITVPLASAPITVFPQPELRVRYFHERDVFADDPFTPEIEPSIPYSLGLQVLNVGYGDARGLRLAGGAPQIIGNEKGLQIEFKTLATQLESQSLSPSLDIDLGAIASGTNRSARWLFSSTIQGSFTNFAASFEHTDALGGRRLSLIRDVEIHELTRIVQAGAPDNDGRADYLVNDVADAALLPDAIYLSNGVREPVQAVIEAELVPTGLPGEFQVAIQPVSGWAYVRLGLSEDLGTLKSVTRPDGTKLAEQNLWQTDRFFRGGDLRPIRTNLVHWFDRAPAGTYRLSFAEPQPVLVDAEAPNSHVEALPANSPLEFTLRWTGDDGAGSGVALYDVYFSVDGGSWVRWIEKTPETSAWFRGELGKKYAFYSVATDRAGNREPAPALGDASTATTLVNRAPEIVGDLNVGVDEGAVLEGFLRATDADSGQRVRFEVLGGAPTGWLLDGDTGHYYWNPSEADGPSTWNVRVRAFDNGNPVRSVDSVLRVTVREVNQSPTLVNPGDFLVLERARLSVALVASDPDRPVQTLRYSLVHGPDGAGVDAVTGDFTWRPRADQGGQSYSVQVRVTDNGTPVLSADAVFAVAVRDTSSDLLLVAGRTAVANGDAGELPFSINAAPDLADLSFQLELPSDRVQVPAIVALAPEVKSATLVPVGLDRSEFRIQLRQGGSLLATRALLRLGFQTAASPKSALVRVIPENLGGHTEAGGSPGTLASESGHIVLVGEDPLLLMQWSTEAGSDGAELVVHGLPGVQYTLETRDRVEEGDWHEVGTGEIPPDALLDIWNEPMLRSEAVFRVVTRAPR